MNNAELLEYYRKDIIQCLIKYGGFEEKEAQQRIDESGLIPNLDDEVALSNFFHEEPYYWAMYLIQDDPGWYHNPKLWPPPKDYYEMKID
ncbi:MAG: hypothetical protein GWN14_07215 [candidate division Zixibacteria bacterium]|nr:hypothetical protein [Gammaproteobacteria bacterium]NIX55713.1 hypothetical protein [candidate division Zixibacteria bacterium]